MILIWGRTEKGTPNTKRGENMPDTYKSLSDLIQNDSQAGQYFSSLPDHVREQINQRGTHVNSLSSLKDYAENLLRGDN